MSSLHSSLEQALQNSSDAFVSLDNDFRLTFANESALTLLGLSEDEVLRSSLTELLCDFDKRRVRDILSLKPKWDENFRLARFSGSECQMRLFPANPGYGAWLRPAFNNIEGRNVVEEQVDQTASTLRAIIDGSPLAIVATDASGAVTVWNPAAEKTLGFRRDAVLAKPSPLQFKANEFFHDAECRVRHADGREIEILCSVAPINSDDPSCGSVAMFLDITERQRLRRGAEHQQKMESLGVLAGGVAHDFNNLLTGILGNASLCLASVDENAEVTSFLNEILRAGERAATLTRQLLAYTGKGRFIAKPLKLNDVALEITDLFRLPGHHHKQITIELDIEPSMPPIEGDAGQLQQVILNLVTNAIEAIHEHGPGTIHVRTRTETVSGVIPGGESSEALIPGRYAILEVQDTGVGMDAYTRARIFEPFFSTKFTGRGLSLPAVLGIVRQHRGAITAQSFPGEGSTFRVYLPVLEQTVLQRHRAALSPSGGTILVAHDEDTVRSSIRRSLEHWGYEVVFSDCEQDAWTSLPETASELRAIFLDLGPDPHRGEEVLANVRRLNREVPVILVSDLPDTLQGMSGAAALVIRKSFTPEELGRTLCEALSGKTLGQCSFS